MHYGFTASRRGLTVPQVNRLATVLHLNRKLITDIHIGCCVGGDAMLWDLIIMTMPHVVIHYHWPLNKKLVWEGYKLRPHDVNYEPREYIERNADIVEVCARLIACPSSMSESLRSGTWSTLRAAKAIKKPYMLILPDGQLENSDVSASYKH